MQSLRIGLLYSLSGAMAAYERPMLDAALMAIDEINQSGGILGWPVEPVVADSCSDLWVFLSESRRLLETEAITMLFGGGSSEMRKAIIPLLEVHNALLWYPHQYEGVELSRNVFYSGSCPNQKVEPAINWLLSQGYRKFYLMGADCVSSRLVNRIIQGQLHYQGGFVVGETYVPQGEVDFEGEIAQIKHFQPDVLLNTLAPDSQQNFYRQYHQAGITPEQIPTLSVCLSEVDLQVLGEAAVGHYAAWSYFQGQPTLAGRRFDVQYRSRYGSHLPLSDPIATAYSQMFLWRHAMESAESFRVDDIRVAAYGEQFSSPLGSLTLNINHHCSRGCSIGRSNAQQKFDIVHVHSESIEPLPWLGVETAGFGSGIVVMDMLEQVSRSMQQAWELTQKSAELEATASQLQEEVVERYRAEEESRLLFDISQSMAEATTFESAMELALSKVCEVTFWPYGEVWMPSEDGQRLQHTSIWRLDETLVTPENACRLRDFREMSQSVDVERGQNVLGRVWSSGQAEWTSCFYDFSALIVPILAPQHSLRTGLETMKKGTSARVVAVLIFLQPGAQVEDKRLVLLISKVAAQLGSTVQQKQAERELRRKNEQLALALQQLQAAQDELVHSEKMVALGQLVAGVAHEINTPLGAICSSAEYISGYLQHDLLNLTSFFQNFTLRQEKFFERMLCRDRQPSGVMSSRERRAQRRSLQKSLESAGLFNARTLSEQLMALRPSDEDLEQLFPLLKEPNSELFIQGLGRLLELKNSSQDINIAAERASKVVFALKTYARYDHQGEKIEANMEESLETILTLYQNKLKHGIEVQRSYDRIAPIVCHPDELNQVWMNLIHNAIQAMDGRGCLGIITRQHQPEWIQITIADTGCGIPEEVQARMFEPFFTTKPPGEGSGLGLDIVQKIVRKHGGKIKVTSQAGCTTFTVLLPVGQKAAEAQEAAESEIGI